MCKILVLLLAILSACAHLATSTEDPHLCIKNVEVPYTVTERVSLDNYGEFTKILKSLSVLGEMRTVEKIKLEPREVCCDGYQPSAIPGEGCQPVPTTTEEPEESSTAAPIEDKPIVPMARSMSSKLIRSCDLFTFVLIAFMLDY
ncbi:hypothetical protein AWZ03_013206 [Drosophila navojoa]|uniref:EMI domain-containing protein n=1 Tax=Drosophila navojoa TaxID=7232 RepID=A0A484AV81_DRONA|nr:uncharacterized protein LOC115564745 [Drosophila navojoa]TDG40376.1 hypothetical protein AWZ03_013206 [Drosophila navojoa]